MESKGVYLFISALFCLKHTSAASLSDVINSTQGIHASTTAHISPSSTSASVLVATVGPNVTVPLPPSPPSVSCPKSLKVCWQDNPPYFIQENMTGVFRDEIQGIFQKCCSGSEESVAKLEFVAEAKDDQDLRNCTVSSSIELTFPVRHKHLAASSSYLFNVVQSPGIALVLNRKRLEEEAKANVWKAFLQIWTVLVLAILLAAIFGIIIWALVSDFVSPLL